MAVLLSGTTIGGHVAVHANNISTYAITSVPANVITTSGGQTIAGTTYFSGGESLNLYGIRGRFTNEYIHLYNKVGIGHPSGWGQGEGNTPGYGLSTYGGMNIAYGNGASSTINGYLRINQNWAGGDYSAEALTIRGTYPSITLRSTGNNSKWLIHHANGNPLQFYFGGAVDNNEWYKKIEFASDGNIWSAYYGDWLSNIFNSKQNASTAITTSNIGSQSVSYASSAGTAGQVSGVSVSATEMNRLKTTLGATGLPYSCDIYVEGDPNTYYPVHFIWGDQDVWRRVIIKRGYSEEAPWDPVGSGVHHGGLLLDWEGNFGGWGGAEYSDRLRVFNESYTNVCADMYIYTHSMGYVFMLRGGHALYHIFSDQEIRGYHQVGTPDIAYSTSTLFYDHSIEAYKVYAPAPVTTINSSRIDGLRTKKQSLFDGRYQQSATAINTGNIGSQSVNYAVTSGTSSATTQTNFSSLTVGGLDVATREYVTSQGYLTSLPSHTHTIANVTGLQAALDGKQAAGSYAASSHTHGASSITSGTFGAGHYLFPYQSGITGASAPGYTQGAIEIYTDSNHVPAIGFHRGGYSATTLYEYDGQLYVNAWTTRAQTGLLLSTGNIGSYAAAVSHTHDDRYYTESEVDNLLSGKLSSDSDSEQSVGGNTFRFNLGGNRANIDPRWNESGYDADLGVFHMYATTSAGATWGRTGIALYNGSAYQYLTTRSGTTGIFLNNQEIIHSGNIGSQSVNYAATAGSAPANGGNSSTVGGYSVSVGASANTIPTRNSSGYLIPESWIQLNGIYGLYSGTNNAHFYPSNGTYGPWRVAGGRGGWNGLEFDASNGQVVLMVNPSSNTTGFHNNSYGWQFFWESGVLYVYKSTYGGGTQATVLDSSNYSSWAQPIASAINTGNIGSQSVNYAVTSGTSSATTQTNFSELSIGGLDVATREYVTSQGYLTSLPSHTHTFASLTSKPTTISGYGITDAITTGNIGSQSVSRASGVSITGFGTDSFTYHQTPGNVHSWTGGWASHFIGNHGNGDTYYSQSIIMPFWGVPRYQRNEAGAKVGPWQFITEENIATQSVSFATTSGSATSSTTANRLDNYGINYGSDWNTWGVYGKLVASSYHANTGANKPPTYTYGSFLSFLNSGADSFQIAIPENQVNGTGKERAMHFRSAWNGTWSSWRQVVDIQNNVCDILADGNSTLIVRQGVGYNQPFNSNIEIHGSVDNWAYGKFRFRVQNEAGTEPVYGAQFRIERFSVNTGWQLLGMVPRNSQNLEWQGDILPGLSDQRVKENVATLTDGVAIVQQINPVEFDWKPVENVSEREGHDIGFIAQQLEEIVPTAVHTRSDGYKTVKYEKVVPILVQAIKEQQSMIELLSARLDALEQK